ncbi:hypothetical protein GUITHDRAFT_107373 [Guillardia theta CCMP2712]|uniref:SREBP regulating gene protein n=1 Tax=Guillardia theta (strain CCMP2712) TaxID=905079 RepID=L1JDJ2_GUITC|nr:hypothetical protein GUITHDRAFT_107373 [Guillardia theta CCMP2712]EKX46586.1 hypothetical protein GUITHDRAFT_107373 [Guillardia theta CCMP2712]|eukprot:XP_005833566.1 hypothetical protein GUITHDRAFT_107373 [Guillardia theta CCMP2712]
MAALLILMAMMGLAAGLEPSSGSGSVCRNTVQGPKHVVDDQGYFCSVDQVDYQTGCCDTKKVTEPRWSCRSCEAETKCCDHYENCVSCCLNPSNDELRNTAMAASRDKKTFADAVKRKDSFEFCRASCRTSSKSTVHGNAYISEKRFCLSPSILSNTLPADVAVTVGKQGESCAEVCSSVGKRCDTRYITSINTCEVLQKNFPCKNTCEKNYGHDQPAYVSAQSNTEMFGASV